MYIIYSFVFSNPPPAFPDNIFPTPSHHGLGTISFERSAANSLGGNHLAKSKLCTVKLVHLGPEIAGLRRVTKVRK
jgi:hypothetical protein